MKICYIGNAQSIHMQRWVEWFANKGHEIHLISRDMGNFAETDNIKIHLLNGHGKMNFIRNLFKASRLIKEIKPDILHAHTIFDSGVYGAFSGFHPFILSPWGGDVLNIVNEEWYKKWLAKYALKHVDAVSAFSKILTNGLMKLNCPKDKMVKLRISCVDTNIFHPSRKSKDFGMGMKSNNDFLILCCRWFKPIYNVEVLIKAVPHVIKEMDNVKFIMLGGGYLEEDLRELSEKLGVKDHILFIGEVSHDEMPKYLANADVYVDTAVLPSAMNKELLDESVGVGTTTIEAMSCCTATLLANNIRNTGYPYKTYYPFDHVDLAKQIVNLLKNKEMREGIAKESREFVVRTAGEDIIMKTWEETYKLKIQSLGEKNG